MKQQFSFLVYLFFSLFLLIYIWFKFIKERFLKEIPFNLSLLSFTSIILICCICILNIKFVLRLINFDGIFVTIKNHILQPLKDLHYKIRTLPQIKKYFQSSILYLLPYLKENYKIFVNIEIFIQACMLYFFMVDVVILHKIFYSYKIIYVLIASYIIKCFMGVIHQVGFEEMKILDDQVDIYLGNLAGPVMRIDYFIEQQVLRYIKNQKPITYSLLLKLDYRIAETNRLKLKENEVLNTDAIYKNRRGVLSLIRDMKYIIYLYQSGQDSYKYFSVIKSGIYLTLWIYILIASIHTLDIINIFKIFKSIYENPFL